MTSKDSSSKGLGPGSTARGGLSTRSSSRLRGGGLFAGGDRDGQLSDGGQQDQEFIQALGRQQSLGGEQGRQERRDPADQEPEGEESQQERQRERWTCDAAIVRKDLANLPRLTATNFDA